jgi:hypothetical protein
VASGPAEGALKDILKEFSCHYASRAARRRPLRQAGRLTLQQKAPPGFPEGAERFQTRLELVDHVRGDDEGVLQGAGDEVTTLEGARSGATKGIRAIQGMVPTEFHAAQDVLP